MVRKKQLHKGMREQRKYCNIYIIGRDSYWISRSNWKMVFPKWFDSKSWIQAKEQ